MTVDEELQRLRAEVAAKTTRIMRLAIERNAYRTLADKSPDRETRERACELAKAFAKQESAS